MNISNNHNIVPSLPLYLTSSAALPLEFFNKIFHIFETIGDWSFKLCRHHFLATSFSPCKF